MKIHTTKLFQTFKVILYRIGVFDLARRIYLRIDQNHKNDIKNAKAFYATLVNPGDLCFDVGANLGQTIDCLSDLGCQVISFEPNPYCVDLLNQRYKSKPQVEIIPIALSAEEGEAKLHFQGTASTASLREDWPYEADEERIIKVSTLESMINKYGRPNMIKIDVEGFELEVVRGLKTVVPLIVFEIHKRETELGNKVLEQIISLGGFKGIKATTGDHSEWLIETWSSNIELTELWKKTDSEFANIVVHSNPASNLLN